MRKVTVRGLLARKLRLVLTALAIVLGVTFVTGTLILADTLNRTFNTLIGTAYQHVSFEIRGTAPTTVAPRPPQGTADRKPVPAVARARRPPRAGSRVRATGPSTATPSSWTATATRSGAAAVRRSGSRSTPTGSSRPYRLVAGQAPDDRRRRRDGQGDGNQVRLRGRRPGPRADLPRPPQTFTITGIVTFGSDNNLAGVTLAGFDLPTAQAPVQFPGSLRHDQRAGRAGRGQRRFSWRSPGSCRPGVEVVSGQTVANELSSAVDNELGFISTALLIFAAISLFVGGFTIFNTFSITVGQRTRELALLRVVGASRRQVFRSVLGEAALTGLVASLIGLGVGVLAALGLKALLKAFGIELPSAPLVFEARTVVVALAVGVGVTVISAIVPARRAVRIAPVAALVEDGGERGRVGAPAARDRRDRRRGPRRLVAVVAGLAKPTVALVGLGAVLVFIAVAMLVPVLARPLSSALGRPLASLLGTPGKAGAGELDAQPAPDRTDLRRAHDRARAGLDDRRARRLALDVGQGQRRQRGQRRLPRHRLGRLQQIGGARGFAATGSHHGDHDLPGAVRVQGLALDARRRDARQPAKDGHSARHGPAAALPRWPPGELLIDTTTASADNLARRLCGRRSGSPRPGASTMTIGGIYKPNPLVGSFVVGDAFFLSHFDNPLPIGVLLSTAPGAPDLGPALNRVLTPYANVGYKTRAQFEQSQQDKINQELGLVYVLLALAVLVALIGIVNTLMLSVFERTREIGLLRAVGMKRRQVRVMIRSEAVIVALFGAVVGIVVGAGLGVALASSLREQRRHEHRRPDPEPDRVPDPRRRARSDRRHLAGPTGREPRRAAAIATE